MYASLYVCACLIFLAAGVAFYFRWRMTGEAPIGLLSAGMVTFTISQLSLALSDPAVAATPTWHSISAVARLVAILPTGWLFWRCLRSNEVDSALRPMRLALTWGAATAAVALLIGVAQGEADLPGPLTTGQAAASDAFVAVLVALLGVGFSCRARYLPRPVSSRMAVVLGGLALALLMRAVAAVQWPALWVPSGVAAVMSTVMCALLAIAMLRSMIDFNGLAIMTLSVRAQSAEAAVRQEQERMHELRATVAGIRQASGTLNRYAQALEVGHKVRLEQMMSAELARLERLLSDQRTDETGPVLLDDVVRPLVTSQREQGQNVRWQPCGVYALVRADEVAEIVHILLVNARQHAPGATAEVYVDVTEDSVRVHVRDDGPGIPEHFTEQMFARGARSAESRGQGLGLHIARRLAHRQPGDLNHIASPEATGAHFVLTLRPISDPLSSEPFLSSSEVRSHDN